MKWKDFFTKVYLVNLPEMKDRLEISHNALEKEGIEYELFVATKNEDGVVGLLQTMKRLFTEVLKTDIQNFIVLEDDFKFLLPPNGFLNILVDQLPSDYHCLFLGCNLLSRPMRVSENLLKIGSSYCTQAIGYNRKVIELILPLLENVLAYDIQLMKFIQPLDHCYCTYPMMCIQLPGYSSIEKGEKDWASFQSVTYATHTKGI